MQLRDKNPVLILVDIQNAFLEDHYWGGNRNNKNAEAVCGNILNIWRRLQLPIFHVRHSSVNIKSMLHQSHAGFEFNAHVQPLEGEPVITKQVNSAFIGTDLKEQLDELGINTVVIVGITTNHCVSTTTRMAGNFGYDTYVVSDATATFDRKGIHGETYDAETIHLTTLANLNEEFATVWDSKTLLDKI